MKKLPRKKRRLGIGVSISVLLLLVTVMFVLTTVVPENVELSPPVVAGAANSAAMSLLVFIGISFFLFLMTMAVLYYFLTH